VIGPAGRHEVCFSLRDRTTPVGISRQISPFPARTHDIS
jgi:hypothetical protein